MHRRGHTRGHMRGNRRGYIRGKERGYRRRYIRGHMRGHIRGHMRGYRRGNIGEHRRVSLTLTSSEREEKTVLPLLGGFRPATAENAQMLSTYKVTRLRRRFSVKLF